MLSLKFLWGCQMASETVPVSNSEGLYLFHEDFDQMCRDEKECKKATLVIIEFLEQLLSGSAPLSP